MNSSAEASVFTDTLLSVVRLQRHMGVRVIVSTQEPTISTDLLNLCSVTIVHRFTSPVADLIAADTPPETDMTDVAGRFVETYWNIEAQ